MDSQPAPPTSFERPTSPEIAAILLACQATGTPVASSPCLRCEHSTVLQLSDGQALESTPAGLEASPPSLVVFCGRMHRDIVAPVARCSGFNSAP